MTSSLLLLGALLLVVLGLRRRHDEVGQALGDLLPRHTQLTVRVVVQHRGGLEFDELEVAEVGVGEHLLEDRVDHDEVDPALQATVEFRDVLVAAPVASQDDVGAGNDGLREPEVLGVPAGGPARGLLRLELLTVVEVVLLFGEDIAQEFQHLRGPGLLVLHLLEDHVLTGQLELALFAGFELRLLLLERGDLVLGAQSALDSGANFIEDQVPNLFTIDVIDLNNVPEILPCLISILPTYYH